MKVPAGSLAATEAAKSTVHVWRCMPASTWFWLGYVIHIIAVGCSFQAWDIGDNVPNGRVPKLSCYASKNKAQ